MRRRSRPGQLVLGDGRQEAGGWPPLLVGLFRKAGPDCLDGGQAQLGQHQTKTRRIGNGGGLHAGSPVLWMLPSSSS